MASNKTMNLIEELEKQLKLAREAKNEGAVIALKVAIRIVKKHLKEDTDELGDKPAPEECTS